MQAVTFPELGCTVYGAAFTAPELPEDHVLAGFTAPEDGLVTSACSTATLPAATAATAR